MKWADIMYNYLLVNTKNILAVSLMFRSIEFLKTYSIWLLSQSNAFFHSNVIFNSSQSSQVMR